MVAAAVAAWAAASVLHLDIYSGALFGVGVALIVSFATYFAVVKPIQNSTRIPNEEKEIFVLTGTLLWGIMIQELIAYFFTNNAKTVLPIVEASSTSSATARRATTSSPRWCAASRSACSGCW